MTTPVQRALGRVEDEREHVRKLRDGFDGFEREVRQLSPVSPRSHRQSGGVAAGGAVTAQSLAGRASRDHCGRIRELFADHVQALVRVGDESLLETVRGELGDRVALALAPTTDTSFTEPIKSQLLSATAQRQTKLDAMERALGAEADSLRRTVEATPAIEDCLDPADRRPLLSLGFAELRERHEALLSCERRLEQLVESRQQHLQAATGADATVGLTHHSLTDYLYDMLPTTYPALSTHTELLEFCREQQRAVRDHLTRRV
ncbi:DUF7260 family protein [Halovenus salina]|uniref:DUF7260 family protein n=1 Tax=Halovenus salina TaxID=1510225 RepID=UPI002260BC52|nr:hypothetical protein [Halovenus salina]